MLIAPWRNFLALFLFLIDDVMINVTSSRLRYGYERTIHAFWAASMGNGSCSSTFIDNFLKKNLCMTSQWTIAGDVIRMTSLYDHYDVTTVFATTGNTCPIRVHFMWVIPTLFDDVMQNVTSLFSRYRYQMTVHASRASLRWYGSGSCRLSPRFQQTKYMWRHNWPFSMTS